MVGSRASGSGNTGRCLLDILREGQDQPLTTEELMTWQLPCVLALVFAAADEHGKADKYPRPKLLIEPAQLAKAEAAKKFRALDARSSEKYQAGHIKGATWVDTAAWHKKFTARQDKTAWEKLLGGLGIDTATPVVVYGDDLRDTARIWWILHFWGLKDVRILNGGWEAWKGAGGKVEKGDDPKNYEPKETKLSPVAGRLAAKEQLLKELKSEQVQIADARTRNENIGQARTAKRNGRIPGAVHLEWKDVLDENMQRFKGPAELTQLFKETGIDLKKPTVCYCQSGGRAAVLAFALELMGARDVRNYYRSWAEWGNAKDTPVEKPKTEK
jgi:thiosulfate/3-mercaptopyruvate sulfurtransferase